MIVMKFGGSSVENASAIARVAGIVRSRRRERPLVVVSAGAKVCLPDASGQVTEQPRLTLFQNGVLIQNNESFNGPTGIQYGDFRGQPKTGPLVLQGDHDPVQFRNIWIVPL